MTPTPPETSSLADDLAALDLAARRGGDVSPPHETLPLAGELAALGQAARRLGDDDLADALRGAVGLAKHACDRITHLAALYSAAAMFRRSGSGGAGVLLETVRLLLHCMGQMPRGSCSSCSLRELTMDEVVGALGRQAAERDRLVGELAALRVELAAERHARGLAERMAADLAAHAPTPRPPSSPRSPSSRSPAATVPCPAST